jgi:uncharacterized protein (DUF1800 family)
MSVKTVSHNEFFFLLGQADRTSLEASKPLHDAYVKATPEQQADLKHRAVVQYVMGKLSTPEKACTQAEAEKIVAKTRAQRTKEQEKVVNAAGQKARYHLITRGKDSKPAPKSHGKVAVGKKDVSDLQDFIIERELTREQVKALFEQALEGLQF